jgi:hypothetical protein
MLARCLMAGASTAAAGAAARAQQQSESVVVETSRGRLRGFRRDGVVLFRGIPYPEGDSLIQHFLENRESANGV